MNRYMLAVVFAVIVVIGGIAYASIPGPDGVIHGCYKTNNPAQGAVIAIDSAANCPSGYTTLNWNQTGPQGPPGISGLTLRGPTATNIAPGQSHQVEATCAGQEKIISGGYFASNPSLVVQGSRPRDDVRAWLVDVYNSGVTETTITYYALCALVAA